MGTSTAVAVIHGEQPRWMDLLDPNRKFYNNWRLICLNTWILLFLIPSMLYGFDSSLMNGLQSLEQWVEDFNHPTGSKLGLLIALQVYGRLAWATFGCAKLPNSWSWRLPSLTQGVPSFPQILLLWFAPESPRWLACNGREIQALKTLAHYHADGNLRDPLVIYELGEIKAAIAADRETARNVGWSSFVKVPGNRKRLQIIVALGFFSVTSGNGLIAYYLGEVIKTVGITDPTMQLLLNGLLQVWNLIISTAASCLVDRLGRRFLFLSSSAGMLVSFIMITACSAIFEERGDKGAARAVIASIFLFMTAYCFGFLPLYSLYAIEILPLSIRAKGLAILSFVTNIFLIFNQYVNPIALSALGWKYYIFYVALLAFELGYYYFFIIETKGMTLEETSVLFDDKTRTSSQSMDSSEAERALSVITSEIGACEAKSAEGNLVTACVNPPGATKEGVLPQMTIDCIQGESESGRQREGVIVPREMWTTP